MRNTGRACGICGALMVLVAIDDAWVERCNHSGVTACPEPRVEWLHGHSPEPGRAPMGQQFYALNTNTSTASAGG